MKPSIFLSHSWTDKFFVRKLAENLIAAGASVWIDEAEINVGDSLIVKISEGIANADFLGVILSHNSVESSWVQTELKLAMTQEIISKKVKILPILIEKCEMPLYLRDKLYADFTDPSKFDESFKMLLKALNIAPSFTTFPVAKTKAPILVKPNASLDTFIDLSIDDVDKIKTYKPDSHLELYNVYFRLNHRPSQEWTQIFDAERRFPRHTMWRRAWVDGQFIVVHCALEEVKKYHLRDIKEDVANTNNKYRQYLQHQAIQKQQEIDKKSEEQRKIDNTLDDLDL